MNTSFSFAERHDDYSLGQSAGDLSIPNHHDGAREEEEEDGGAAEETLGDERSAGSPGHFRDRGSERYSVSLVKRILQGL